MLTSGVHIVTGGTDGDPLCSWVCISEYPDFDGGMGDDSWYFWSFFTSDSVGYLTDKIILLFSKPDGRLVIKFVGDGVELALWEFGKCIRDFALHRSYTAWCVCTEEVCPLHLAFLEAEFAEIP